MLLTALLSLLAGGLTVLAPCVLPFLPVIVGGSLSGERRRPYLIAGSLVVSLIASTLLLKASTILIKVDPMVWTTVSGGIVILLGLSMLFPAAWAKVSNVLHLDHGSHTLLDKAKSHKSGSLSAILTGVALGPVFSSCSPIYAWVIASVLPASPAAGVVYLGLYCLGVAAALLGISLAGRKVINRLKWAANPRGTFQRVIAILFILVGLFIATGVDKKVQTWAVANLPSTGALEEKLVPRDLPAEVSNGSDKKDSEGFNADYEAPELKDLQDWINSDPLTLEELRGRVVLIDFWTYSCINCIRTQPYLNAWYAAYHDQGFEIIGVHAPEFAFERVPENVRQAVQDAQIEYPVALDNDFATWGAFNNHYWPAKYLIDADGRVRYTHFGEGGYEETEANIRALLNTSGAMADPVTAGQHAAHGQSPETYLGTDRAMGYVGTPRLKKGTEDYQPRAEITSNRWTLGGWWQVDGESITARSDGATLTYRFDGRQMFLVMSGPPGSAVQVRVNGEEQYPGVDVTDGVAQVGEARLYRLVDLPEFTTGTLVELTFSQGVQANAFTFGG